MIVISMTKIQTPCSHNYLLTTEKNFAYLAPGAIDEDLGQPLLSESEKFLVQDVRQEIGRLYVATFLGFEDEWKKKCDRNSATTPSTRKIFDLVYLYATHGNQHFLAVGPDEGMHRCGGYIEALLGSEIEPSTGRVLKPENLSYKILIDNGLKSMTGIDLKTNFQDHVEAVLSGDTPSPFFDKTSDVEFSYIGNRVYLVADILEQFFF